MGHFRVQWNVWTSALIGWLFLILDTLVVGTPIAVLAAEVMREGRLTGKGGVETALGIFVSSWLLLLVLWLAQGRRQSPRASFAFRCLVVSLALMGFAIGRPILQSG
jgi:hypothetical protein